MAESKITHPAPPPVSKPSGQTWDQKRATEQAAKVPPPARSAYEDAEPATPAKRPEDAPQNLEVDRDDKEGVIYDQFHPSGTRDTREKPKEKPTNG